ncbi:hypothetical protein Ddc_04361 [Ditylenchus destructor]|nr:hypothetical protein Ddc_04361 [Ditylenchus destructor]
MFSDSGNNVLSSAICVGREEKSKQRPLGSLRKRKLAGRSAPHRHTTDSIIPGGTPVHIIKGGGGREWVQPAGRAGHRHGHHLPHTTQTEHSLPEREPQISTWWTERGVPSSSQNVPFTLGWRISRARLVVAAKFGFEDCLW